MIRVISLMLLISFCFPVIAVDEVANNKQESDYVIELKINKIKLEEQNKLLKSSLNDLRASYYWSLSFAATFLLLFLGVNVYFFRNRYKDDKEYLLQKIDAESKKIIESSCDLIESKVDGLKSEVSRHISENLKKSVSGMESKVSSLSNDIQNSRVDIIKLNIENTKRTGVKANVLRKYFELFRESRKLKGPHWDWQVSEGLEEMYKLLCDGAEFDPSESSEVSGFLNGLPEKFSDGVHKVRTKLRGK